MLSLALALTGCLSPPDELETLEPPAPFQQQTGEVTSGIVLPIEVFGREGTSRTVTVTVSDQDARQPLKLWLQVHGLSYANKASVQFNSGTWLPLRNDTVNVEGLGKTYGGIGGAFATLKLSLNVPSGALVTGSNQISFRFNTADERSLGFRVLKLNLLRADGSRVLPDSAFTVDDPNTWQPPFTDAASIAEGENLWRTRTLVTSYKNSQTLRAHCMDCHAQDGRDLKYFNYSNASIIERAKFHGMGDTEAKKIASYIRTLPGVPNPGRPWNPPYQPGPGLDAKPVTQWAAGAGVDAVLEKDRDILRYMFPNGITKAAIATTANLSAREVPLAYQLPDWNHWLPSIHPKDAWGDAFTNHRINKLYAFEGTATGVNASVRQLASKVRAAGYTNYRTELFYPHRTWTQANYEFLQPRYQNATTGLDINYSRKIYSTALWQLVKTWEVMQEFGLEGQQRQLFPTSRETRGWMSNTTFESSPNLLKLPRNNTGINDNSPAMFTYFSMAWYQLSLVLYNGNHWDGADRDGQRPIDWGYVHAFISEMQRIGTTPTPTNGLLTLWLVKGMQISNTTLKPSTPGSAGWSPRTAADLSRLVVPSNMSGWAGITADERRAILEALLSTWWDKTRQYPASDWRTSGGGASTTEVINGFYDSSLGNRIWYLLPQFKYHGVNAQLINEIADWAKTVWPQADWNQVKYATCAPYQYYVRCTSEKY
ncbi:hypothetical protein JRI60_21830 [Archangium violaceum]|uniref:hypothetical protein n=1 Tax=Archangium violaceum TaxID=83451 RepID=UPI001950A955|nr:hypothetical protein [Archangium violaceum]QRO01469.1 hypothetical protein JRI60_21830 [Archangium violaceum]